MLRTPQNTSLVKISSRTERLPCNNLYIYSTLTTSSVKCPIATKLHIFSYIQYISTHTHTYSCMAMYHSTDKMLYQTTDCMAEFTSQRRAQRRTTTHNDAHNVSSHSGPSTLSHENNVCRPWKSAWKWTPAIDKRIIPANIRLPMKMIFNRCYEITPFYFCRSVLVKCQENSTVGKCTHTLSSHQFNPERSPS